MKKKVSTICEIMNINADFRIFVNVENRGHTFVENARILTYANIQRKVLMFDEVGAPESSFLD